MINTKSFFKTFLLALGLMLSTGMWGANIFTLGSPEVNGTYIAPGWNVDPASHAEYVGATNSFSMHIESALGGQWQGQLKVNHVTTMETTKKYRLSVTFASNNAIGGVTIKLDDNTGAVLKQDFAIPAGGEGATFTSNAFTGFTNGNGILVLDFGYAPANTDVVVSNISIEEDNSVPEVIVPTEAPTAPTHAADDVLALWSDSYTKVSGYSWQEWGGCALSAMEISGNMIERASGFKYLGSQFNTTDVSGYEYFHVDLYPTAATTIGIVPITTKAEGGNNPERGVTTAVLPANQWTSIDIAMTDFIGNGVIGLDRLYQIKYIKQVTPEGAETNADGSFDLFVDNVYFWKAPSDAPKQVSATVNDLAMGTAVVKQNGETVTEAAIGSNVDFVAEENDGYLFLGWYRGSDLVSTNRTYTVVDVQANTTLQARFRALNNIYCHTELVNGEKSIFMTMKKVDENQYQVVIDSETEMKGFGNAYIGKINGNSQINLNSTEAKTNNIVWNANKHRVTINVTSTTPIRWNTPVYVLMPGEVAFAAPQNQTIEYDVTCDPIAVETVTLSQTEATLDVEGSVTLTTSIAPIYADNQAVVWTSDNETIATVENGVVTGHVEGNATITATVDGKTATCAVTVALDPTVPHVAPRTPTHDISNVINVYCDQYGGNNANVANRDWNWKYTSATEKNLFSATQYMVEDCGSFGLQPRTGIADMDYLHVDLWAMQDMSGYVSIEGNNGRQDFTITGGQWTSVEINVSDKAPGTNWIMIYLGESSTSNGKTNNVDLFVTNVYFWKSSGTAAVTGVELNQTSASLEVGEQVLLKASILPIDAANKNITWTSSDDNIATVEDGNVTAVAEGDATITVTTEDGEFTATCNVTVSAVTEKKFFAIAEDENAHAYYLITRNEERTLTFDVAVYGTGVSVYQVNDGDWHNLVNDNGVRSWTSEKTYAKNEVFNYFLYFPARFDRSYTVGSESAPYTRESLIVGNYGTLCLPFDADIEGAILYTVSSSNGEAITISEAGTHAEAGKGYIFKATAATLTATYTAVAAHGTNENLVGNIAETIIDVNSSTDDIYVLSGGAFHHLTGTATCTMGANRAYVVLPKASAAPARMRIVEGTNVATGMEDIATGENVVKFIENGTIYIMRNAHVYDMMGRLVK